MTPTAALNPTERFNCLMEGLFNDVAAEVPKYWRAIPVIVFVWRRLFRLKARFASIMARFHAGRLAAGPLPAAGSARRPARVRPAGSSRPPLLAPRFGWVIYGISWFVWGRHYELEEMLEEPETAAQVASAPQLGRVLRPLCQMLAVKPPAWLRLPRRARRVVEKFPPAPDWLVNEPGTELRSDGSVWMYLGSSTHWKPGCGQTLEEARKFDPPIRIWPRPD